MTLVTVLDQTGDGLMSWEDNIHIQFNLVILASCDGGVAKVLTKLLWGGGVSPIVPPESKLLSNHSYWQ